MQFVDHADLSRHVRCASCGYDIHGLTSDACPECGAICWLALAQFDKKGEFDAAIAALCAEDIEHQSKTQTSNSAAINHIMGFRVPEIDSGMVFVKRSDLKRAATIVETVDGRLALPIVDRSEPVCPQCDGTLDPLGRSECPTCGLHFDWVDIDPADFEAE